jgi:hypothetical protein
MVSDYAARIFATALLDPGPDLNSQPSKLWMSRSDFQHDRTDDEAPVLPLDSVVEGFCRLHTESDPSHTPLAPASTQVPLVDVPFETPCHVDNQIAVQTQGSMPISTRATKLDRRSKKHLDLLHNMRQRIALALQTLHLPSEKTLSDAERELGIIRQALEKVNRRNHTVLEQKKAVYNDLEVLAQQVTQLRQDDFPKTSNPVLFNSSEYPLFQCT